MTPGLCREQPSAETVVNNAFSLVWLASAGSGDKWTTRQNEKMTNKKENTSGVALNYMQHEGTGGMCGSLWCEGADWRPARFDPPQSQQPLRVRDKVALVSKLHFFSFLARGKAAVCRAEGFLRKLNAERGHVWMWENIVCGRVLSLPCSL